VNRTLVFAGVLHSYVVAALKMGSSLTVSSSKFNLRFCLGLLRFSLLVRSVGKEITKIASRVLQMYTIYHCLLLIWPQTDYSSRHDNYRNHLTSTMTIECGHLLAAVLSSANRNVINIVYENGYTRQRGVYTREHSRLCTAMEKGNVWKWLQYKNNVGCLLDVAVIMCYCGLLWTQQYLQIL
jgi:hypothetical protein